MRAEELVFRQGFGTRRECRALVRDGRLAAAGSTIDDPDLAIEVADGLHYTVDGESWTYRERAVVVLHKPAGVECSARPRDHPSVLALLPAPLCRRGVQPVGRLDADTTGVLLLTDDGALLHRLTSPKRGVEKVYEVQCRHPVDERQLALLRDGVTLRDGPTPVRADAAVATGPASIRLTLHAGRYHQVKRMIAAAGNRVERLHRSAFAGVRVDDVAAGAWRWLDGGERAPLG